MKYTSCVLGGDDQVCVVCSKPLILKPPLSQLVDECLWGEKRERVSEVSDCALESGCACACVVGGETTKDHGNAHVVVRTGNYSSAPTPSTRHLRRNRCVRRSIIYTHLIALQRACHVPKSASGGAPPINPRSARCTVGRVTRPSPIAVFTWPRRKLLLES
jgi:hypothetical protein